MSRIIILNIQKLCNVENWDKFNEKLNIPYRLHWFYFYDADKKILKDGCYPENLWNNLISEFQNLPEMAQIFDLNQSLKTLYESFKNHISVLDPSNKNGNRCYLLIYIYDSDFKDGLISSCISECMKHDRRQIIFTGPPGTGKTFSVRKAVENIIIRNIKNTNLTPMQQPRISKKLLELCIINHSRDNCKEEVAHSIEVPKAEVAIKTDYTKFIQFHSSYDYTDFIEGLRPVVIGKQTDGTPITQFVRLDGTFKAFCRKAATELYRTYFFIIDEINRADLSKVFGEIMFCLEGNYRGENNRVPTQYSNLPTYEKQVDGTFAPMENDIFEEGFYIPENVVLIGTMNDIDRSVESFDFALRRRFKWIDIKARDTMYLALSNVLRDPELLQEVCMRATLLNEEIAKSEYRLGTSYQLGQSYFHDYAKKKNADYAGSYFEQELRPILSEYVRGRRNSETFLDNCKTQFLLEVNELQEEFDKLDKEKKPVEMPDNKITDEASNQ